MVFLDSHCECNVGWLEPLLSEIKHDRRTVPSPVIDVIQFETFEYMQAMPQVRVILYPCDVRRLGNCLERATV